MRSTCRNFVDFISLIFLFYFVLLLLPLLMARRVISLWGPEAPSLAVSARYMSPLEPEFAVKASLGAAGLVWSVF